MAAGTGTREGIIRNRDSKVRYLGTLSPTQTSAGTAMTLRYPKVPYLLSTDSICEP